MRRIYEVEFEHKKCLIRIKRNKTYAILARFMIEPLLRNLCEINLGLGYYFKLEDVLDDCVIGIVLVLRDDKYFLMYRKFNPYV